MFSYKIQSTLLQASLFQNVPVYVQFYVTARCNLTCQQCNIIYTNSDVRECSLDEVKGIADNFAKMRVAMVLLTGGEPFVRTDLPEIIHAFESRGVHVRMQTNGLASEEQIARAIEAGGHDISISLDTLSPEKQDAINGGFKESWHRALRQIALFTKYLPKKKSFASLGCVLQRRNMGDILDVVKFATAIQWYMSLVPIHISDNLHPMGFRTYDKSLDFRPEDYAQLDRVIEQMRTMRKQGYLLYDSDQYLDDIKRFIRKEPVTWRKKNENVCDSPNLYFALLPNGHFAPCCDHRIDSSIPAFAKDFPEKYRATSFRKEVYKITSQCPGCMYGSYPEMTIAMRFMAATLQKFHLFFVKPVEKKWPVSYEAMLTLAEKIRNESCALKNA